MFDKFKSRAEAVSAEVHRFSTKDEALMFIIDVLKKEGVSDSPRAYAVWADCPFLKGIDRAMLAGKVPGLTFEVTRETAAMSHVGPGFNAFRTATGLVPVIYSHSAGRYRWAPGRHALSADEDKPQREQLHSDDNRTEQDSGY